MKRAAAVALALLAAAAFIVAATRPVDREPTDAELAWVRGFVEWRETRWRGIAVAYDELRTRPSPERAAAMAAGLTSCSSSLEDELGRPSSLLAGVRAATRSACFASERAARRLLQSEGADAAGARRALLDADQAFVRSDRSLDGLLLLGRALPTVDAPSTESRVDLRLSEAATAVSAVPMSVRCWSSDDWPRVERELRALVGEDRSGERLAGGGAWEGDPSLSPLVCRSLQSLLLGDPRRSPDALASGLRVLGREVAHAAGTIDEARAECRGTRLVPALAAALGAPPDVSGELGALAWAQLRAEHEGDPQVRPLPCAGRLTR